MSGPDVVKEVAEPWREVLVEKKLQFVPTATSLRSRSAANARQGLDVITSQVGEIPEYFFLRHTGRQIVEHVGDRPCASRECTACRYVYRARW